MVRGSPDLFGRDHAMLVLNTGSNDASRQLCVRLEITVSPAADLTNMQKLHNVLVEYRDFDYGVYDEPSNN